MMNNFTWMFLAGLAGVTLLELWLQYRQQHALAAGEGHILPVMAGRISEEEQRTASRYARARLAPNWLSLPLAVVIVLAWTLGGGVDWLASHWQALSWPPLWQEVGLVLSFLLVGALLELPLSLWRTFHVEAQFGFNRTTVKRFATDTLLGLMLAAVLLVPLVAGLVWFMQDGPRSWWLAAWLLWLTVTLGLAWAWPRLLAPLFNRFTPLPEGVLRETLEQLVRDSGFTAEGIYVMDGSRRSSHGNAYFTGLGNHKRIVLFDTLVDKLEVEELAAVLAHELGHFKRGHILKGLTLSALLALLGFFLFAWISGQSWFYSGLGVTHASAGTALALAVLLLSVVSIVLQPLLSWLSRHHEFEADAFAAGKVGAAAMIRALSKLYRDNASFVVPDRWYAAVYYSHPPPAERIQKLES